MAEKHKTESRVRAPILVVAGHVDHGKTTLLDRIRGTAVTKLEPGMLSQHVGASFIPLDTVKNICGNLLEKLKIEIKIPGLLLIDTPGHAAFITLRRRGGAVSDLAILVVDATEGFQEQTDESLAVLKHFKVPFVVAATKIDKIPGWNPRQGLCFGESFALQREDVKEDLEKKIYRLVSQLAERGFNSERFDRIEDFSKQVAIVPVSSVSGEGIAELLMVLAGLTQQFLKEKLGISETGRGTILEVKETRGFGTTIDVILYDGSVRRNDYLVIGGRSPVVTKVKALLRPRPLAELRVEKQFSAVEEVAAAAGIKIAALGLEAVVAGSPIIVVKSEKDVDAAKKEVQREVEEVQFERGVDGVVVKADTLGSLEAMVKILAGENVPVRKAEVGSVNREDVIESQNVSDSLRRVVLAFNVRAPDDVRGLAGDLGIKIFENDVIYRLVDEYKEWRRQSREREMEEKLAKATRPVKIMVLKGCIFRVSKPCIVGVEVLEGYLKSGVRLDNEAGKTVGKIKEIQREGKSIGEAKKGDRVAISMDEPIAGRHVSEGDVLVSHLTATDKSVLMEVYEKLGADEKELLKNF